MKKYPLIFIAGPTAAGKSRLAFELAKRILADIVSCDSMLVYKEPEIIVDKPGKRVLNEVKHHLTGIVSVEEEFDVFKFKTLADKIIKDSLSKKNLVFVGGSGLYIKTILDGLFEGASASDEVRKGFLKRIESEGLYSLYEELKRVDPESAAKISGNDLRRITRALEVYYVSKKPLSSKQKESKGCWGKVPIKIFGLKMDREKLYERINLRVDKMVDRGALKEVRNLLGYKLSKTSEKILGIKEFKHCIDGEWSIEKAKDELKKNTRRYAKRQMIWFRKDKRIEWMDVEGKDSEDIVEEVLAKMQSEALK